MSRGRCSGALVRQLILATLCLWVGTVAAAELQLQITPTANGAPLLLNSLRYQLNGGETISFTRLSFLLSGFAVEKKSGGWVELPGQIAWMDAATRRDSAQLENIPAGEYRALRFAVGLDPKSNHADPATHAADHPLNPNLNGLHWTWQDGYIFLAVEGLWSSPSPLGGERAGVRGAAASELPGTSSSAFNPSPSIPLPSEGRGRFDAEFLRGFSYHFANDWNRTVVSVPLEFTLASQPVALGLAFDVAALFNGPRPVSPARDGESTHSREGDPLAAALKVNLASALQLRGITDATVIAKRTPVKPLYLPAKFTPYPFQMSATFPVPDLPRDNPLIEERVALGERLFHEARLSRDNSLSCASCHDARHAFTDPRRYSLGVDGQVGTRHAMPLFNLAWKSSFFWDGRAPTLRAQALLPIQDHTEMDENLERVVKKLSAPESRRPHSLTPGFSPVTSQPDSTSTASAVSTARETVKTVSRPAAPDTGLKPGVNEKEMGARQMDYPSLFTAAFGTPEITPEKIGLALENFLLTLTSFDSKFDRAHRGEPGVTLTDQEKRGFELFFTEYDPRRGQFGADCFHCHGGANFSSHGFANNGLDATLADFGRFAVTGREADRGQFSVPSLRNVALTAPYMHDGRFATLEKVVEHYSTGVKRSPTLDPNLAKHPDGGVPLSAEDRRALVAFLKSLTDQRWAEIAARK